MLFSAASGDSFNGDDDSSKLPGSAEFGDGKNHCFIQVR